MIALCSPVCAALRAAYRQASLDLQQNAPFCSQLTKVGEALRAAAYFYATKCECAAPVAKFALASST